MIPVINAADKFLRASPSRYGQLFDRDLRLSASALAFEVALDSSVSPAQIVFIASMLGVDGVATFTTNNGSVLSVNGNVATLVPAGLVGNGCVVTATMTVQGEQFVARQSVLKVLAFDPSVPPAPSGLTAVGKLASVQLNWAATNNTNISKVEIWRSLSNSLAGAVALDATAGLAKTYTDNLGAAGAYFYWIRYISKANVIGPFNAVAGTAGVAGTDASYLLDVLTAQLSESQLLPALQSRIDLIDAADTGLVDRVNALVDSVGDNESSGTYAAQAAQSAADAIAAKAAALLARDASATAATQSEQSRLGAVSANQTASNSATAANTSASNASTYATNSETAAAASNTAKLAAEAASGVAGGHASAANVSKQAAAASATAAGESASAASTSATAASTKAADALTYRNQAAQSVTDAAGYAQASAQDYTAIAARLNNSGGTGSSVEQRFTATASSITGLSGQVTTKIDLNGYVTGYGLMSTANTDAPTSEFTILAAAFKVVAPGASPTLMFTVANGVVGFNGRLIGPSGTLGDLEVLTHIRCGQTAYNNGIGFWQGIVGGVAKWSVGNSAGAHMKFDGSAFTLNGVTINSPVISNPTLDAFSLGGTFIDEIFGINANAGGTAQVANFNAVPAGGKAPHKVLWQVSRTSGPNLALTTSDPTALSFSVTCAASNNVTVGFSVTCLCSDDAGRSIPRSGYGNITYGSA